MEPVNEPFGNTEKLEPVSNAEKIEDIQNALDRYDDADDVEEIVQATRAITMYAYDWLRFLQSELDDERAAHNEHAAELCRQDEEIRQLREELDREKTEWLEVMRREQDERTKLLTAIQSIQQERDKLLEGLREYKAALNSRWRNADRYYENTREPFQLGMERAYDIAENLLTDYVGDIGVGEERT